jgi:hypothetical protein
MPDETGVALLGIAYDDGGERYDSYGADREFADFIASCKPNACSVHDDGWVKVDTTDSAVTVTAAGQVELPTGESRAFSFWKCRPGPNLPAICLYDRTLKLEQGEYGWIGVYFGLPVGVKQQLPYRPYVQIDLFVKMMKEHFPGWDPPGPDPTYRKARELTMAE